MPVIDAMFFGDAIFQFGHDGSFRRAANGQQHTLLLPGMLDCRQKRAHLLEVGITLPPALAL